MKKLLILLLFGILLSSCRTFVGESEFIVNESMINPSDISRYKYQYIIDGDQGILYFRSNKQYLPGDTIKIK